jgi:outer membrane protein OmpA-like peptidoglycan-associated protein
MKPCGNETMKKKTMKKIILLSIFCVFTLSIFAQQDAFNWRIGAYGGYNFYRGDLNNDLKLFQASQPLNSLPNTDWQGLLAYGASLEHSSQGFGLKLLGTRGIFQANDRAVNRQGDFIPHTNFDRSLNAETQLYDASILATFYSDNGQFLSRSALVSPYLSIGFGGTYFNVFSDLLDANNRQYYYWSDGLIYDKPEFSVPPNITELIQDNSFETEITNAENEGVNYKNIVWNVPVAIGLKFRVSERLNLNLEMMARYVNSDYLDDVSQRGSLDNKDIYGLASVSLHYNFSRKSADFVPPVFYSLGAEKKEAANSNAKVEVVETIIDTTKKVSITKMEIVPITENINRKPNLKLTKEEVLNANPTAKFETEETIETVIDTTKKVVISEAETAPITVNPKPNPNAEYIQKPTPKAEVVVDTIRKVVVEMVEKPVVINTPTKTETVIDTIKKVVVVEQPKIETPTKLTNDKIFNAAEQTYLEVQKTRLEVAKLNEQANILLQHYDASKVDSFAILNQKVEALNKKLQTYQQYINNLAIQGNAAYTKPENQAIKQRTSALEAETEALRQKYRILVLGEDDPKAIEKELAKIEAKNEAKKAENEALDAEIKALERAYLKANLTERLENSSNTPVKTGTAKPVPNVKNINPVNTAIYTLTVEIIDSLGDSAIAIEVLSDSAVFVVNAYDVKLKALTNELTRLQMTVISQKNQIIDSLKTKVNYLEGELKGIQETNKYWADFFQKQIASLQAEITKLNQNQTVVATTPKPSVIEKTTVSTTKTLQELVDYFGVFNVYFDRGKTNIKAEFSTRLNRVALLMNQNPEIVVVLKGYTDKSGNPELNFKLSKKRAEAVKTYLTNQGVSTLKVDISYFGENPLAAVNDPLSRKVEVVLMVQ